MATGLEQVFETVTPLALAQPFDSTATTFISSVVPGRWAWCACSLTLAGARAFLWWFDRPQESFMTKNSVYTSSVQ